MIRINKALVLFVSLLFITNGCGSRSSPEDITKEQIKAFNDYADAVDRNASDAELVTIDKRIQSLEKQHDDALNKAVQSGGQGEDPQKYQNEWEKAVGRYLQAKDKVSQRKGTK